jgi:hypothetical protein
MQKTEYPFLSQAMKYKLLTRHLRSILSLLSPKHSSYMENIKQNMTNNSLGTPQLESFPVVLIASYVYMCILAPL